MTSAHHAALSREVLSTTGYLSVHPKEQFLGLGADTRAELTVVWPNGERQRFGGGVADRRYVLVQGGELAARPRPSGR